MDEKSPHQQADDEFPEQSGNREGPMAFQPAGAEREGEVSAEAPRFGDGAVATKSDAGAAAAAAIGGEIADGQLRMLDPRFVRMERVSSWITTGVIAIGAGFGVVVAALSVDVRWLALGLAGGWLGLFGLLFWWGYRYPQWFYAHARFKLEEKGIEIRRGVWWRQVIDVPRSRVQHTDVTQGPLMRRYGIARLVIHTAGTENASVDLNGLDRPTALLIRDFLIRGGESDGA